MAVVIGSSADEIIIRIQFRDVTGEEVIKTFPLDPTISDANVVAMANDISALSNAGVIKASVVTSRPLTGWAAAANSLQNNVGNIAVLTFQKVNPINANKTLTRGFIVPAYLDAIRNTTDQKPVTGNATLNALIALLEDNLTWQAPTGTFYPGGWTYNRTKSGFGTVDRELGDQPGF